MSLFGIIKKYKSGFVGTVATYTFWGALDKVIPFLLLPIFTRLFTEDEVGFYSLYQTLMIIVPPILTCDVDASISINYFHYDKDKLSKLVFNSMLYVLTVYLVIMIVSFLCRGFISNLIKFPYKELSIIITNTLFLLFFNILLCIYRNENKSLNYGVLSLTKTIISYSISLFLIFKCSFTWKGIIYGDFVAGLLICSVSLFLLFRKGYIQNVFDVTLLKDSLRTGFPSALHNIGAWLSNNFNQMLVNVLIGIGATGQYGVGATYGMVVSFVHTSINKAYIPYVYNCLKEKQLPSVKSLIRKLYVVIIGIFFIVSFFGIFLNDFIYGDLYSGVKKFIIPLVLSSTMWGLYKIHVSFLFYYKRVWSITMITISTGLLNIPISYFMISTFGILGAAYSAVIASTITYILIFLSSKKTISKCYED